MADFDTAFALREKASSECMETHAQINVAEQGLGTIRDK